VIHRCPQAAAGLDALFRESGYEPETAGDARSGYERARELRPSLIVLDPLLPEGAGTQLLLRLPADPVLRDVPVLLVSGAGPVEKGDPEAPRAPEVPAAFIESPARPEHLLAVVEVMLAAGAAGVPSP